MSDRPTQSVARAALLVAAVTAAARLVGLVRTVVLAATVGDSGVLGNTYAAANTLPNIVFEVVAGGALASLVVPVLAGAVTRGDDGRARATASGLLTWTVVVLTPVALLGAVFARPLMSLLVTGVDDPAVRAAQVDLGARMLVVFMPQVVLYGVGIVLAGVLQAHRRFVGPALAPLLSSLVVMGAYLIYAALDRGAAASQVTHTEELVLSVGTTLGVAALTLSLIVPASRLGLALRPSLQLPAGVGAQVRRLALAGGAGVVAQQVALLVALVITSSRPGAVIAYQLSYAVFLLPWGVLAVPIATGAFPALAGAAEDDPVRYAGTLAAALRSMVVVCAGAAAVGWALHRPLAYLLPYHPDARDAGGGRAAVAGGIAVLVVGLVPYGVLALLTRALFARGRTLAAAAATVTGFAVTAVASLALAAADPDSPVRAVGLAHSIGMAVAAALLVVAIRRDSGPVSLQGAARAALISIPAASAAAAAGWLVTRRVPVPAGRGSLLAGCAAGAVVVGLVYVALLAVARSRELGDAVKMLRDRRAAGG